MHLPGEIRTPGPPGTVPVSIDPNPNPNPNLPGEIRPPGPPGMAPVSVEAVAAAAVAGALGKKTGSVDGNAAIAAASA